MTTFHSIAGSSAGMMTEGTVNASGASFPRRASPNACVDSGGGTARQSSGSSSMRTGRFATYDSGVNGFDGRFSQSGRVLYADLVMFGLAGHRIWIPAVGKMVSLRGSQIAGRRVPGLERPAARQQVPRRLLWAGHRESGLGDDDLRRRCAKGPRRRTERISVEILHVADGCAEHARHVVRL